MPDGNGSANGRGAGGGRSFFVQRNLETGRHEAYQQAIDGEYVFRVDRGGKAPFDTYNDDTAELQGIIQACVDDGKPLRAHGALWSLSTVAVTPGRLLDNIALRLAFEVPANLANPAYAGDPSKLRFVECGNSVAALNDYLFAAGLIDQGLRIQQWANTRRRAFDRHTWWCLQLRGDAGDGRGAASPHRPKPRGLSGAQDLSRHASGFCC